MTENWPILDRNFSQNRPRFDRLLNYIYEFVCLIWKAELCEPLDHKSTFKAVFNEAKLKMVVTGIVSERKCGQTHAHISYFFLCIEVSAKHKAVLGTDSIFPQSFFVKKYLPGEQINDPSWGRTLSTFVPPSKSLICASHPCRAFWADAGTLQEP